MKFVYVLIFSIGILLPSISSRHVQFYRKDYKYIEKFDAFYKLHWDISGMDWNMAFLTCDDEGSTLFYPKAGGEWALVKNLTSTMAELPNVTEIFVGFHDEFNLGEFMTVDGQSTPYPLPAEEINPLEPQEKKCITMNIENGVFNVDSCLRTPDTPLPFVCKKLDDESCPTVDRGYKYVKTSNKCYKINKRPKMWQEAMKTCFMEGGVLVVIENEAQADVISDIADISNSHYFVGVRRLFSHSELYTVKGQKFSEMYQRSYNEQNYDCGTIYKDGNSILTSTGECGNRLPFICEMEVAVPAG